MKRTSNMHVRRGYDTDMPEIYSIDERCRSEYWGEEKIMSELHRPSTHTLVAEIGNCIVGFMIYEVKKEKIRVLRVASRFDEYARASESAMMAHLKSPEFDEKRPHIVVAVSKRDPSRQKLLEKHGFVPTGRIKKAPWGEALRVMACEVSLQPEPEPGVVCNQEQTAVASREPRAGIRFSASPQSEIFRQIRQKLTETTSMEWHFTNAPATTDAPDQDNRGCDLGNGPHISLTTYGKVTNPVKALEALKEFLGIDKHAACPVMAQAGHVTVPVSWFRPIHLHAGRPGCLAEAFTPADLEPGLGAQPPIPPNDRRGR